MRPPTLFATLSLAILMTLALPAQTVRVIFVSGQASIQRPEEAALRPAVKGETVIVGTRVVTGPDGRLVLTPMPGVKSIIAPNTTLLLESVSETRTSPTEVTHQAVLDLKQGAVVSDLQKPEGVSYDYSIRTARGLAGARGTTFTVGINPAGIQTIVVAHGSISISFADGSKAVLSPGQLSITKASGQTESVTGVGELSATDQKIAQNWTEITVAAIASSLEAGVELDPSALKNALDTSTSLGIRLSPETQGAVDRALSAPQRRPASGDTHPPPPQPTPPQAPGPITDLRNVRTALDLFRARLTAPRVIAFDVLPGDIKALLVTLNDLDIAAVALDPDSETGLPLTDQDLRIHLSAFAELPADALAFIKTLAGPNLATLENTPDPAEWSIAAFQRTLVSWNALTSTERSQIITLGAGEAIMDTSAGYISALLAALTPTQASLITQAGWGSYLEELSGKPTNQTIFQRAGNLTPAQLATVKLFEISPHYFNDNSLFPVLVALTNLSPVDQATVLQLQIGNSILDTIRNDPLARYSDKIANALNFYRGLLPAEQVAARAIGLGDFFYTYTPTQLVADGVTALTRAKQFTAFYIANPALRQALQDTRLFSDHYFQFNSGALDTTLVTTTLNAYLNLPARTRTYLALADHSESFFSLANPNLRPFTTSARTLSDINSILGALTPGEFTTLLDMDLGRVVLESGDNDDGVVPFPFINGSPVDEIKAALGYYTQLDATKKFVLRELGIIGNQNIAVLGADTEGLSRLLTAYGTLPGTLRAATEKLQEFGPNFGATYGGAASNLPDRSFFFPRGYDADTVMYSIGFQSPGDLYVGATNYLSIDGSSRDGVTFRAGFNKSVHLYASNLIDLTATDFSAGIRSITMSAATINLTNIVFPDSSVASLNSKLGQLNFGSSAPGKVNLTDVRYGTSDILDANNFSSATRGNIRIGTLANPAALPTYTPPPTFSAGGGTVPPQGPL